MAYQPVVFNYQDDVHFAINGYIDDSYKVIGWGADQHDNDTTIVKFHGLTPDAAWKISVLVTQFLRDYKPGFQIEIET